LPAPLHLAGPLARYRQLTVSERLSVVPAALAMWLTDLSGPGQEAASIGEWLDRHGQGDRARGQFWDMFLLPILNAAADQADLSTAAELINGALLSGRDHADLGIASVPLRDVHGGPAARLLTRLGAEVRVGAEVTAVTREPGGGYSLRIATGGAPGPGGQLSFGAGDPDLIRAAGVVLAVPAWDAQALVPAELAVAAARWESLEPAPVMSIHVIYDSPVTKLPFAAATGSPLRWITDKTRSAGLHTAQYLAASVPAAGQYVDAPSAGLREQFLPELERLFPAAARARVEDFFVTRERRATFRPLPGSRALRPAQATQLPGFALAGAWTDTGWPDSMESAVRSGAAAGQAVIRALAGPRAREAAAPQRVPAPRAERAGPRVLSGAVRRVGRPGSAAPPDSSAARPDTGGSAVPAQRSDRPEKPSLARDDSPAEMPCPARAHGPEGEASVARADGPADTSSLSRADGPAETSFLSRADGPAGEAAPANVGNSAEKAAPDGPGGPAGEATPAPAPAKPGRKRQARGAAKSGTAAAEQSGAAFRPPADPGRGDPASAGHSGAAARP
jgi:hypothetical protein